MNLKFQALKYMAKEAPSISSQHHLKEMGQSDSLD
jgi:hypothetical protein